jgi:hypothetical protein
MLCVSIHEGQTPGYNFGSSAESSTRFVQGQKTAADGRKFPKEYSNPMNSSVVSPRWRIAMGIYTGIK